MKKVIIHRQFELLAFALCVLLMLSSCMKSLELRFPAPSPNFTYNTGLTFLNHKVRMQPSVAYAAGSKLQVSFFNSSDSVVYNHNGTYNSNAVDTVFSTYTMKCGHIRVQWKVTGPANDSLSGGMLKSSQWCSPDSLLIRY